MPPTQQSPAQSKADQIVWRYLHKVVLLLANARLTTESQDVPDAAAAALISAATGDPSGGRGPSQTNDMDDAGTPTGSISVAVAGPSAPTATNTPSAKSSGKGKQTGPRVDKWFNLEIPDHDSFKATMNLYRNISTSWPVSPVDSVVDPPPLVIQVLLSIPPPATNQVLVLRHANHRTRIETKRCYILLESWRIDIVRPTSTRSRPARANTASSTSSATSSSQSSTASGSSTYDVELPIVYKQAIALFRSMYTLLRILPAWKLHRRLRRTGRNRLAGLTLELRVDTPQSSPSASRSSTTSLEDLLPVYDSAPVIGFKTPLSQHATANKIESFTFNPIPSPLGELVLSMKYRAETQFSLESLESLLSSGFVSADQALQFEGGGSSTPIELYCVSSDPPPDYPVAPYPPISRALTKEEDREQRRSQGMAASPPPAGALREATRLPQPSRDDHGDRQIGRVSDDRDFEMVADFTPTVVAEQQRRRKESQTRPTSGALSPQLGSVGLGVPSGSGTRFPSRAGGGLSPRSQPASLPREPLAARPSSLGSEQERLAVAGSTYSLSGTAAASDTAGGPLRSRYNSIPHSSSPLTNVPRPDLTAQRNPQQFANHPSSPMLSTPTQYTSQHPLPSVEHTPLEAPPMHSRTISMPSGRPPSNLGSAHTPISSRFSFSRPDDLPFASPVNTNPLGSIRRRKESSSALSSTSSGANSSALPLPSSPTRTGTAYSPRSRPLGLPSQVPSFTRREGALITPPNAFGPIPLPSTSTTGPRRPSLNTIHPFKSSTLSSSPSSFGAGRINSPLSERASASPMPSGVGTNPTTATQQPGSYGSGRQSNTGAGTADLSQSPRSPGVGRPSTESPNPYGSYSPSPDPASKRLSGSSLESGGVPGASSRRLSNYSAEAGAANPATGALPVGKRYSSSFSHRYANSTSTTGSVAVGGVPGSLGSAGHESSGRSSGQPIGTLGLAGVGSTPSSAGRREQTDDDALATMLRDIEARPPLRGGGSPASNPSTGSLPRVAEREPESAQTSAAGRTGLTVSTAPEVLRRLEASSAIDLSPITEASTANTLGRSSSIAFSNRANLEQQMNRMQATFEDTVNRVQQTRSRNAGSPARTSIRDVAEGSGGQSPRSPVPSRQDSLSSPGGANSGTGSRFRRSGQ